MFSDVLSCFPVFFSCFQPLWITTPCVDIFSHDAFNWSQIFYRDSQMCSRCAQMFSDVHRCFQMITSPQWSLMVLFLLNLPYSEKIKLTCQNENFEIVFLLENTFGWMLTLCQTLVLCFSFPGEISRIWGFSVGFDMTDMGRINYSGGGAGEGEGGACRCQTLGFMSPLLAAWQPEKRLCRIAALLMLLTM